MPSSKREDLIARKKQLQKELDDVRRAFNDYLQGEGPWAGHEHSMHDAHETSVRLLEKKIYEVEQELNSDGIEIKVVVTRDGQEREMLVVSMPTEPHHVSVASPIGQAAIKLKENEVIRIDVPAGLVTIRRLN